MAFARWDPFRDLISMQHRLDRLAATGPQGWGPAVDLCETATAFLITVELPGVARDQIKIEMHGDRITVHGRRDARVACEHYHQVERGHGEFSRTFALPNPGDAAGLVADLSHGVLTITVPKAVAPRPHRVSVS